MTYPMAQVNNEKYRMSTLKFRRFRVTDPHHAENVSAEHRYCTLIVARVKYTNPVGPEHFRL